MSITDELREELAICVKNNWMTTATRKEFLAIADRIDAEHKRACDDAWDNGYEADYLGIENWLIEHPQIMERHGWVRLPKDADGEVIHVGDVMEERSGHTFEVATLMAFGGRDNWLVLSDPRNFSSFREPHDIRHYHAPTVEDVLREMLYKAHIYDRQEMDKLLPDLISEYAAKLRLAGDTE